MKSTHQDRIVEQFTRQAVPFSEMVGHSHEEALQRLLDATHAGPDDTVLDVACGPGLVALAFAPVVRHVTGMDVTPAMLDRARVLQAERGLTNLTWHGGAVEHLPFPDAAFSIVCCRYSLHHFLAPRAVVAEMARVCAPGGRVALVDVFTTPEKSDAYNHMEKLRDPSHVRALTLPELHGLAGGCGLSDVTTEFYRLEVELETLLAASFPEPGDADRIREIFAADLDRDDLGVAAHRRGDAIHLGYPIALIVGTRPAI